VGVHPFEKRTVLIGSNDFAVLVVSRLVASCTSRSTLYLLPSESHLGVGIPHGVESPLMVGTSPVGIPPGVELQCETTQRYACNVGPASCLSPLNNLLES
jgi:hypothetical protein